MSFPVLSKSGARHPGASRRALRFEIIRSMFRRPGRESGDGATARSKGEANLPASALRPAIGWWAWSCVASIFFVNGAIYGVWATQIPLAKQRLALDPSTLGATLFLVGFGALVAMSASGWILQRIGAAALIRASAALFCALLPVVCNAPSVWSLGLALFFFGASGGIMDVAMNVAASGVETRAERPYMSSFHGMWSMGGVIGAGFATLLESFTPPAFPGLLMAASLAAIFVIGQRTLHDETPSRSLAKSHGLALRPSRTAALVGLMAALAFGGEGAVLDWAAIYLREQLGSSVAHANAGYAAFSATMAIGRFCGDKIRGFVDGPALIRSGCILAIIGVLAGPISGSAGVAVVGYALTGLGFSNIVPILFSAAGAMPRPETQIAAVSTLGYAGLLAAPPLFGLIAHATSLADIFYVVAGATGAIAAFAVLCAPSQPDA
jgi:predicted MFS family arabinose efflux permease